jgi:DNA repair protein RecN (Recombination protein N)
VARARTFVFDEVDAGLGGRAALEVGRRLAELARENQVIVVTHLAQVAAFADRHIVVEKTVEEGNTLTTARTLAASERPKELTRLLSGVEDSASAMAHAEELLDLAIATRGGAA